MARTLQVAARRQGDYNEVRTAVPITVTAVANTDFSFTVPGGALGIGFTEFTTTAFGAATDATLQLGSTLGGSDLVAAVSIKALGVAILTRAATGAAILLGPQGQGGITIYGRIVQSGAFSAVGGATLLCSYGLPT